MKTSSAKGVLTKENALLLPKHLREEEPFLAIQEEPATPSWRTVVQLEHNLKWKKHRFKKLFFFFIAYGHTHI